MSLTLLILWQTPGRSSLFTFRFECTVHQGRDGAKEELEVTGHIAPPNQEPEGARRIFVLCSLLLTPLGTHGSSYPNLETLSRSCLGDASQMTLCPAVLTVLTTPQKTPERINKIF